MALDGPFAVFTCGRCPARLELPLYEDDANGSRRHAFLPRHSQHVQLRFRPDFVTRLSERHSMPDKGWTVLRVPADPDDPRRVATEKFLCPACRKAHVQDLARFGAQTAVAS